MLVAGGILQNGKGFVGYFDFYGRPWFAYELNTGAVASCSLEASNPYKRVIAATENDFLIWIFNTESGDLEEVLELTDSGTRLPLVPVHASLYYETNLFLVGQDSSSFRFVKYNRGMAFIEVEEEFYVSPSTAVARGLEWGDASKAYIYGHVSDGTTSNLLLLSIDSADGTIFEEL